MIICDVCKKDITNKTVCKAWGYTLCCKHYQQKLKYDHFLDNNPYSQFDSNEFRIENNIAYIILKKRNGTFVGEAIVDATLIDKLIIYKWRLWQGRVFTGNTNPISLAYKVLDIDKQGNSNKLVIDHINGNPLDNRKCNLRVVTQKENSINKALLSNNHSGFLGVCFDKTRNKWSSEIRKDNKKCYLGRYNKKEDAIYARYIAELYVFGEYRSDRNDNLIQQEVDKCKDKSYINNYVKHRLKDIYKIEIVSITL